MAGYRIPADMAKADWTFQDPGAGGTIGSTVGDDKDFAIVPLVSATAESRTLPRPTRSGIWRSVYVMTYGGAITLTVTGGYDPNADTTLVFTAAGQFATFLSAYDGTNYYWLLAASSGLSNLASGRMIATTATTIAMSAAGYSDRDLVLDSTHTTTVTLPQATGSGNRYSIRVGVTGTDGSKVVTVANTTDVIAGGSIAFSTESTTIGFQSTNATTITLNNTTQGGIVGTKITLLDVAAGHYLVDVMTVVSGHAATPFS